jgi:7,8-dihydroneopterin aldolase/epimerase/oxygenase
MSDQIRVNGIKAFGYHGVLPDEAINGQEFTVDLLVTLDLRAATLSDDLNETLNYADLAKIAHDNIVGDRVQLIERLAGRIAEEISSAYSQITSVSVTVHKPHAPVTVDFEDISVTITR